MCCASVLAFVILSGIIVNSLYENIIESLPDI